MSDFVDEYNQLVDRAIEAEAPYRRGEPIMPDDAFDELVDGIHRMEIELLPEQLRPDSPTQRVGHAPMENALPHPVPMLSLSKVTKQEEVEKFLGTFPKGTKFLVQTKLDGISMSLEYENGRLKRAMTRGDGRMGEDATEKMQLLSTVPVHLTLAPTRAITQFTGIIRGEVVIHRDELHPRFRNARNGVAGAVSSSRVQDALDYNARLYAFDVLGQDEPVRFLRGHGFTPAPSIEVDGPLVWDAIQKLVTMRDEGQLPYEVDGVVVKVADPKVRASVEDRTNTPRWAIAFKTPAKPFYSTVLDLELNVGKSGQIGMRYRIAPADSGISTVEFATAHNFSEVARLDVRRGDKVTLRLMGDVIPGIVCVTDPTLRDGTETPFEKPTTCPRCDAPVEEFGTKQQLRCTGTDCVGTLNRRLEHWAGRKQANIDGLSTKMIEQLVEREYLENVADFYQLELDHFVEIGRSHDFAVKMLAAIDASKSVGMRRALVGFSIPNASEGTAERLCKEFESMDALLAASFGQLSGVKDVGVVVATSLHEFFQRPSTVETVGLMASLGVNLNRLPEDAPVSLADTEGMAFSGLTVVVTGVLPIPRDDFKALLVQNGAKMTGSVSKNTDVLVIGDNVGQAKITKAKQLGTKVIDYAAANAMMGF